MADRGITKRELAKRLGILPQNVNGYIATDNLSKLQKVADAIGCDISDFLSPLPQQDMAEINGYIEYNGEIHKIQTMDDFNKLYNKINNTSLWVGFTMK